MRALKSFATWYVIGYLVLISAIAWGLHQINYQAQYRSWQLCMNGNQARASISKAVRTNSDQIKEFGDTLIAASKLGPSRQQTAAEKQQSDAALKFFTQRTQDSHKKALDALSQFKLNDCGNRPR